MIATERMNDPFHHCEVNECDHRSSPAELRAICTWNEAKGQPPRAWNMGGWKEREKIGVTEEREESEMDCFRFPPALPT